MSLQKHKHEFAFSGLNNYNLKIYCVIPAYNEEKNLAAVLEAVRPTVDEMVVVDDGSSDRTAIVAREHGARLLRHVVNRGQGAALKTGTVFALTQGADIIVHFDADGQFLAEEIKTVIEPIRMGRAGMVFGSRFLGGGSKADSMPPFKRNVIMPLARLANRLFLDVNLTDPQSGFRALSRAAAEKMNWWQDGMAHCSEILFAAARSGLKFEEVPITVVYRHFGQRLSGGLKILKDLFIARLIN